MERGFNGSGYESVFGNCLILNRAQRRLLYSYFRSNPRRIKLSAVATMESSFDCGAQPSMRLAFSLVAFLNLPSSGTICRTDASNSEIVRSSQSGSNQAGTRRAALPMLVFKHLGNRLHTYKISGNGQKPLTVGGGIRHSAQVEIRYVSHIDYAKDKRGQPGTVPSINLFTIWMDVEKSGPSTGPNTPTGLTTESSKSPPSRAIKSHAARSARVFDFT